MVCLDFDETLRAPSDAPMPGVAAALAALRAEGMRLLLSSARFSPIYGELNAHRMRKVSLWLEGQGIEVDGIRRFVPAADVYVDDCAYRFGGDWGAELPAVLGRLSPGWKLAGRRGLGRTLSVDLDTVWSGEEPLRGAVEALRELKGRGVKTVVSAGPFLGLGEDARQAPDTRGLRHRLRAAQLEVQRVDAEKITAAVYVNRKGLRYGGGPWAETADAIRALLSGSP